MHNVGTWLPSLYHYGLSFYFICVEAEKKKFEKGQLLTIMSFPWDPNETSVMEFNKVSPFPALFLI